MFNVICIDATDCTINYLKEGKIYTVYAEDDTRFNLPVYYLCEIPESPYCKQRFILLSDIDELELINEKEEVHA